ncbi:MAG: hypothetical protein ABNH00_03950 [Dokdonia sp.]|jgi:hypothetical protein
MKVTDYSNDQILINQIEFITKESYFKFYRELSYSLLEMDERDFAIEFDYYMVKSRFLPLDKDKYPLFNDIPELFIGQYALCKFLFHLTSKNIYILDDYFEHCENTGRQVNEVLNQHYEVLHFKRDFLEFKFNFLFVEMQTRRESLFTTNSKKRPLLIEGKKPNISERFKIANEIFNFYNITKNKNISQTEKHILIAHVLGCSQQTARELFNGTQQNRTRVREGLIETYINKVNRD